MRNTVLKEKKLAKIFKKIYISMGKERMKRGNEKTKAKINLKKKVRNRK